MKILELGKFYPPHRGGIETLLRSWCEGFVGRGAEVNCVVANSNARTHHEKINGVYVHRIGSWATISSTSIAPGYISATRHFAADAWHTHVPNPLADFACLSGNRDTPLVVSYHSDVVRQRGLLAFYRPLQKALLRRASVIVVAAPQILENSCALRPVREKCRVIPFGLDLDRLQLSTDGEDRTRKLRETARGKFIVLNVGRLVGYKGQRYAIEAMRNLDAVLWLVGNGPLEADLRRLVQETGVSDKVRFWGEVPDSELAAIYHACDLFVFPSITPNEAFGLAQVEAMACGKPVVACQLPSGVPYVCADGWTGLTVPPMDSTQLSFAVQRLMDDSTLRRNLGEAGRKRAFAEFSEPQMINRYWTLIGELTANRGTIRDAGGRA